MELGVLANAFPTQNHSRTYVESWVDEMEYADIQDVSKEQRVFLYNAGVMMNGRIYSVDVQPKQMTPTPLRDVLERTPVDERFFLREEDMAQWSYEKVA